MDTITLEPFDRDLPVVTITIWEHDDQWSYSIVRDGDSLDNGIGLSSGMAAVAFAMDSVRQWTDHRYYICTDLG